MRFSSAGCMGGVVTANLCMGSVKLPLEPPSQPFTLREGDRGCLLGWLLFDCRMPALLPPPPPLLLYAELRGLPAVEAGGACRV